MELENIALLIGLAVIVILHIVSEIFYDRQEREIYRENIKGCGVELNEFGEIIERTGGHEDIQGSGKTLDN